MFFQKRFGLTHEDGFSFSNEFGGFQSVIFDENYERENYGREWSTAEIALGLMGDLGDLAKLIQAHLGIRGALPKGEVEAKLAHELADCLWSILVLSDKLQINLEDAFVATMDELEARFK